MPPKKSEKPVDRAGAAPYRDAEDPAPAPQRLNLGCGTLIVAACVIGLLGKFLPHESRRPAAAPAAATPAKAAPKPAPAAKSEIPREEPRRELAVSVKPTPPPRQPAAPEPARLKAAKSSERAPPRESAGVFNDPWTGAVAQVERHLKRGLHDASSFEALEWGPVAATAQGYKVRCTYRAKNLLGVYATQTRTFLLNRHGEVVGVKEKD
jgi:hypothetical protein